MNDPNEMTLRLDDVEMLVDLVAASTVSEVSVEYGERRILVRRAPAAAAPVGAPTAAQAPAAEPDANDGDAGAVAEPAPGAIIPAPMVGVFRATSPAVTVGSVVEPGAVVGAIESMKLMNDVRAGSAGTVEDVLVDDGAPVEYGQPLFAVRPV